MTNTQDSWEEDDWETTDSSQGGRGDRQEERLTSDDPAVLILADGREFHGRMVDISSGGVLFEAEDLLPTIAQGTQVAVRMELYGQPATFPCAMVYQRGNRTGLKLQRTEL